MPDDETDQRGWRQQIEDLLRHAGDLPAPPGSPKSRSGEPSDEELRAQYSIAMAIDEFGVIARAIASQSAKRLIKPSLLDDADDMTDEWQAFIALQAAHFLHDLVATNLAMHRSMLEHAQDERRYFEAIAERMGQANEENLLTIRNVVPESNSQPERIRELEEDIQRFERLLEQIDLRAAGIRRRKPRAAAAFDDLEPPIGLF